MAAEPTQPAGASSFINAPRRSVLDDRRAVPGPSCRLLFGLLRELHMDCRIDFPYRQSAVTRRRVAEQPSKCFELLHDRRHVARPELPHRPDGLLHLAAVHPLGLMGEDIARDRLQPVVLVGEVEQSRIERDQVRAQKRPHELCRSPRRVFCHHPRQ